MGVHIRYFFLAFTSLLLVSCGGNRQNEHDGDVFTRGAGNRWYGGILRINESEYIKNLFPHNITDAYSYRVASQIYEGLFKFDDETLEVIPGLAERYEVDESRTLYTFHLKQGVYFHDDPCFPDGKGRELTAEDVAYAYTRLCTKHRNNQNFSVFEGIVKGADQHYQASSEGRIPEGGVEGIRVVDRYTVEIELVEPNAIFIVNLARPACFIYPREAEERYGIDMRIHAVGTGPFALNHDDVSEDISLVLKKHQRYHGVDEYGNKLPFLNAVSIQFLKEKKTELFEFRKGNLDMIYRLPTEFIIEILEETMPGANGEYSQFELQRSPEMMTQFITLNNQEGIFRNIHVRKAFNFAIDRRKILDFVLNGEGFAPGQHGITPPVYQNYNIETIPGYTLNIDSARYYMARAGFPNGAGFPRLQFLLNAEGDRNTLVAVELQKQLKDHLNVDIELVILPFAQLLERSYTGAYSMLRAGWVADFPSPENFLWLFHSKDVPKGAGEVSYPNVTRYINKEFDQLYEMALNASSIEDANTYFRLAEITLMQDAPVIVLWYDEGYRLVQSYVKNFPNNPMQYRDLSGVYFQKAEIL